jgi:hypothetical protein
VTRATIAKQGFSQVLDLQTLTQKKRKQLQQENSMGLA